MGQPEAIFDWYTYRQGYHGLMRRAEGQICAYAQAHPSDYFAYSPMVAIERGVTTDVYVGLASHKSQFVHGGC